MKHIFLTILAVGFAFLFSFGQDTMYVHTNDMGIVAIPVSSIDSVVFYSLENQANMSVIDIDGNVYRTIQIGDQVWMAENLKVTHAPDGSDIVSYAYNDDESNVDAYGRLYTWTDAMNGSITESTQGICPDGWHIPSDAEFKILEIYYGMTEEEADYANYWRGDGVGTRFLATDDEGFALQLAGRRSNSGSYSLIDSYEYTWTSSEYVDNPYFAWRRCFSATATDVGRWNSFQKTYAFSIRCLKD